MNFGLITDTVEFKIMNTKLKNRFRNRFKMVPILNGKHFYRADYYIRDFKLSVGISLAKFKKI